MCAEFNDEEPTVAMSDSNQAPVADKIPKTAFPIVGIGASAGGFGAFKELLKHLPEDTGMGFVFVQHLDPKHESMLPDLLKGLTKMPVLIAEDGQSVVPDHVYVIPPNHGLGIFHGRLKLLPYIVAGEQPQVINRFLQLLADDLQHLSIGVILSGMGSDGTLGLEAIQANGGLTLAQNQETAECYSMPGSAIAAGVVDGIMAPAEIAAELGRIARSSYLLHKRAGNDQLSENSQELLTAIFLLLRARTGNDFSHYKKNTLLRRIRRRMMVHKLDQLKDYLCLLQAEPNEVEALFDDLLINVTEFFRERDTFEALKTYVFPPLRDERNLGGVFRIWVPACSTGEEAYSLAITILEFLSDRAVVPQVQIFATDIDEKAIEVARSGIYSERIINEVTPAQLKRHFIKTPGGYQIHKSIRDMCVFAVQNITKDPPFSRLNLICCRNLLIYLDAFLQKRLCQMFHYALLPQGFLMLGSSESIGDNIELFKPLDTKSRLYAKKSAATRTVYDFSLDRLTDIILPPAVAQDGDAKPSLQELMCRSLLAEYAPAAVVINDRMEILHFEGTTGPYINPLAGSASLSLVKLVSAELAIELRALVRAAKSGERQQHNQVQYRRNGTKGLVNLKVIPLEMAEGEDRQLLVLFEECSLADPVRLAVPTETTSDASGLQKQVLELERELEATRGHMKTVIEDQETTNEELKSANEEIQSTNEELQSTNEELETAKEELQSTNEELATVNDELEHRNQELSRANSDLVNLLSNVNLPILMLGQDMTIRQFTPQAKQLFNLIDADLGRPIGNINANIEIPDLEMIVLDVVNNMVTREMRLQDNQGTWHLLRIRPYKTIDNRIEGALLAFFDATMKDQQRLAAVVHDATDAITMQDLDGRILAWNPAASRIYGYDEVEALAMNISKLVPSEHIQRHRGVIRGLWEGSVIKPYRTGRIRKDGSTVEVLLSATALINDLGQVYAIATTEQVDGQ